MDRWSGREDDDAVKPGPQGRVARLGIGAFVKQDTGTYRIRACLLLLMLDLYSHSCVIS